MDKILEKTDETKKLPPDQEYNLVKDITENWVKWDDSRDRIKKINEQLQEFIYLSKNPDAVSAKIPEIYETKESYKAHLWRGWFNSYDSMFDIEGINRESQQFAELQKTALIETFRKIKLEQKFEQAIIKWLDTGEMIFFVGWEEITKQVRRKEEVEQPITDEFDIPILDEEGLPLSTKEEQILVKDIPFYKGASVKMIESNSFVFDPNKKDHFDSCPKIYKSWVTYESLLENENYTVSKDAKDFFKNATSSPDKREEFSDEEYDEKGFKNDQIEILEYWGDIKLPDGTFLKNWFITVAGRKHVVRFESNPYIINPFVFGSFTEDPETKRGISPLYVALPLNNISDSILNLQLDALKLIINKPYLAPKGSLSGKIKVEEGKIIEYDPALMPQAPVPLDFKDALVGWDFLSYFEGKIESATGINKFMAGDSVGSDVNTATEARGLMVGASTRLSKELDYLNFQIKIPLIERIAELTANYNFDIEEIRIRDTYGKLDFVKIDETVRQGQYEYIVGDSTSRAERMQDIQELKGIVADFLQVPEVAQRVDMIKLFKHVLEQSNIKDANQFIKTEEELGFGQAPAGPMVSQNETAIQQPPIQGLEGLL